MCGLAGIVGLDMETGGRLIRRMTDSMQHRGPDGEGVFVQNGIALGHRRLSIIDLSDAATQPFTDETDHYVIVFNGEIYNYRQIREKLFREYDWLTHSDTEVLLAAYDFWGRDCMKHLSGMFAFAIYNKDNGELFIARDRLGVKPLYYYMDSHILVFASEIRTLLLSEQVQASLDPDALRDYLHYGFVRSPRTILKDIKQMMPGECGTFKNGGFIKYNYWSLLKYNGYKKLKSSHIKTVEETRRLLEQSVKERMVADVPIGAFLSGGIDSSAVVAMMAGFSKDPVNTYSIVFNEKDYDESEYSKMLAALYKTRHTELLLRPEDLLKELPACLKAMDHPTPDGINTYMVSKLVAGTGIRVVLSGSGGDELFAGYPGFKQWKQFRRFGWLVYIPFLPELVSLLARWRKHRFLLRLAELLKIKEYSLSAFYSSRRSVCSEARIHSLAEIPKKQAKAWFDLRSSYLKILPAYSSYTAAELSHYTTEVLLKDTDQMSMAHALEVREPFFDYRLVDFLLRVRDKHKLKGETPKTLLVEALGQRLPSELVNRPKKGFTFPWKLWLKNELKPFCENALESLGKREGFKTEGIQALWHDFLNDSPDTNWLQVWQLVVLEHWLAENNVK